MKRIGIFFLKKLDPRISVGGKQTTALGITDSLKENHQVTLLHLDKKLNLDELNEIYGTSLTMHNLELFYFKEPFFFFLPLIKNLWLLKQSFMWRKLESLTSDFDVLISTQGEIDLGKPLIQYINFPSPSLFLQEKNLRPLKKFYYKLCNFVFKRSLDSMRNNLTLANSSYTAKIIESVYGMKPRVVYLPVAPILTDEIAWEKREDGFVLISRIHPEKNIHKVIEIIEEIKKQKPKTHLHIIGSLQDKKYGERILDIVKKNQDWIFYEGAMTRDAYLELISKHKYGIHGMPNEHFGIAIAEMISIGLIVFVPANGGQVEIVGDSRLTYDSKLEAIEKILRVINNDSLQSEILKKLEENSKKFTAEAFKQRVNQAVDDFINNSKL